MYFDTHGHLSLCKGLSLEEQIRLLRENKIKKVLDPGIKISDFYERWEKLSPFPEVLFGVALAPHYIKSGTDYSRDYSLLKKILSDYPRVVAISEIGLEYYHVKDKVIREKQREVFYEQLSIAKEFNKPVFLHLRDHLKDVFADAYDIVKSSKWNRVVLHCFTGDYATAKKFVDLGATISFSGIVTFKKSEELVEAAEKLPLESILTETDAPYLSPVPHRGKPNYCHHLIEINKFISKIRNIEIEKLNETLWQNIHKILNLF